MVNRDSSTPLMIKGLRSVVSPITPDNHSAQGKGVVVRDLWALPTATRSASQEAKAASTASHVSPEPDGTDMILIIMQKRIHNKQRFQRTPGTKYGEGNLLFREGQVMG
jgi:hypothetical protein